jgi:hypothetical protein
VQQRACSVQYQPARQRSSASYIDTCSYQSNKSCLFPVPIWYNPCTILVRSLYKLFRGFVQGLYQFGIEFSYHFRTNRLQSLYDRGTILVQKCVQGLYSYKIVKSYWPYHFCTKSYKNRTFPFPGCTKLAPPPGPKLGVIVNLGCRKLDASRRRRA